MSDVSVDIIKNRSGEAPDLPSGANLSGVSTAATLQVTNLNPTHINASGVTTATTFSGSLKSTGTPTLGLGVTINSSGINISGVATAGIVSATTLYGNGENLTGVAMSIAPISYNPDVNDSIVSTGTGIGITFTKRIIAGSGNLTLRVAGAAGTVVENFGVGSSVTINNNSVSITPTSGLTVGDTYHISYPSGAFTNTAGDLDYVGTAYTFGVRGALGQFFAAGNNSNGQLAQNNRTQYSSPVQVGSDTTWEMISAGANWGFGVKTDNTLWAWGDNTGGGLAQNNANPVKYSSPVQIPGTTWAAVSSGGYSSIATKTDGTLWAWGSASYRGQLGLNNRAAYSSPVQVPGTTWGKTRDTLSSGVGMWKSIKTDGTLWSVGAGNYGVNGNNSNADRSSPVQIPGTNWSVVAANQTGGAAIKTDGTLWSWGGNFGGSLGQSQSYSNIKGYSSPVQIPGTTWSKLVKVGPYGYGGVKTDGTLWMWGKNGNGELGQNNVIEYSSPIQIPGTNWRNGCASGAYSSLFTKTDNTMWGWGKNNGGQLGHNSKIKYSSPVQIPGTNWKLSTISGYQIGDTAYMIQI